MSEAVTHPVVVPLPKVIGASDSEKICTQLCSALDHGAAVVADMTRTVLCDLSVLRMLLVVLDRAAESGAQFLLAVSPDGSMLGALNHMGFNEVLQIFPSLQDALAGR